MISNISDYKKIREKWFTSAEGKKKVTVDDKVYGSRGQKLIYRNVDFAYLTEASNIINGVIDNSVMPKYPILASTALPKPPLDNFAALEEVQQLQVSGNDVIMYAGGEDPDIYQIRQGLNDAMDKFYDKVKGLEDVRNQKKQQNQKAYEDEVAACGKEIERLNGETQTAATAHAEALERIDGEFDAAMKQANEEETQARKEYADKTITKEQFNQRMAEIIAKKHEAYLDRFSSKSIENLEYAELQNSLSKQISDQNKEINDASDELAKKNNAADKEYQDAYDTLHEGTYDINNTALENSNGAVGTFYKTTFLKDVKPKIDALSVYHAADNLDKENYWIRGTDNTYFMDRLFADWENTKCRKMTVTSKAHNGGCMEHYTATYDNGIHTEFDRWHSGDNVFLDFHWPEESESATWRITNTIQDVRIGSRYEVGKISSLKLVLQIDGGGVDGFGSMYVVVNANKSKVIEESVLQKLDDEDDLNQTNLNDIEDAYELSKEDLDNQNIKDLDEMNKRYAQKKTEEKDKYDDAVAQINLEYVKKCEPLIQQFNTKVEKGEPTTEISQQLSQARNDRNSHIDEETNKYNDALRQIAEDKDKETADIMKKYQEKLTALQDDRDTKRSSEGTRHSNERHNIIDDYNERYRAKTQSIKDNFEDAVNKAHEERMKKAEALAKQEQDLYDSLVQQWKDSHGGEEPPNPWDDEARQHFKPYTDKLDADQQLYTDYKDEELTERARLEKERDDALANEHKMNENARELWTYDAGPFASFANTFKNSDDIYGDGWRNAKVQNVIAAFAEIDYGFHTGSTYVDYKEKDSKGAGNN